MSTCSNDISFLENGQVIHLNNSRQSTLDDENPPPYSQVAESRDLSYYHKIDAVGLLCLKIIQIDLYFTGILCIFSLMSLITAKQLLLIPCIPILYLILCLIGNKGYKNVTL